MKTWYGVNVEFYDNFDFDEFENEFVSFTEVKACITKRQAKEKPNDQCRRVYGMTSFKIWMMSEINAIELLRLVNSGEVYIDDLISLFNEHAEQRRAA